jgi:hypothetical protein
MRWYATLLALGLPLLAPACAEGGRVRGDTGAPADAFVASVDAGRDVVDAGMDAATPEVDAFVPPTDAFVMPGTDAFVPPTDAFVPPADAFVPPTDAFVPPADAGPPPPPGPGTYLYRRVPVGALTELVAVAFHPDGSYALALERTGALRVYDWATGTTTRVAITAAGGATAYLDDVVFEASGARAWIVGTERTSSADTGVVLRWDDAAWRGGTPTLTRLADARAGEAFTGITFPGPSGGPAGDGRPVVLSQARVGTAYVARLRELDTTTEAFAGLVVARSTSAGCDDLAFVDNEFGTWGIALVCGSGGADTPYYTEIAGTPEWRASPAGTLGNTSSIAAHPSGRYALAIGWSGRRVHRFEGGAWRAASSAPWFTTLGIYGVAFAPDGRRALVVGRAAGSPLRAAVLEYRHDLWSSAEIGDVSIPGFDAPPYNGDSSTYLRDAAFRPGCDGGLIVGGKTDFSGSTGQLIVFTLEGGVACP